jgi:hypothetical protein
MQCSIRVPNSLLAPGTGITIPSFFVLFFGHALGCVGWDGLVCGVGLDGGLRWIGRVMTQCS